MDFKLCSMKMDPFCIILYSATAATSGYAQVLRDALELFEMNLYSRRVGLIISWNLQQGGCLQERRSKDNWTQEVKKKSGIQKDQICLDGKMLRASFNRTSSLKRYAQSGAWYCFEWIETQRHEKETETRKKNRKNFISIRQIQRMHLKKRSRIICSHKTCPDQVQVVEYQKKISN